MYTTSKLVNNEVILSITFDMLSCWVQEEIMEASDPEREVLELWFVTEWLAGKLEEQNEAVVSYGWHNIWLRTTSGQSIELDYCIRQIVDKFNECFHS